MPLCLIVDDDPISRSILESFIERNSDLELAAVCENAIEASGILRQQKIDIIYLDVEMPEMSGLDLIKTLNHFPQVLLVTSQEKYAVEAFDLEVTDYILKPIQYDRFLKATNKAVDRMKKDSVNESTYEYTDKVLLRFGSEPKLVKISEIKYIKAQGDYTEVLTAGNQKTLVLKTLKNWENQLPEKYFIKIHRSVIVNIEYIEKIHDWFNYTFKLELTGLSEEFLVSQKYTAELKKKLS